MITLTGRLGVTMTVPGARTVGNTVVFEDGGSQTAGIIGLHDAEQAQFVADRVNELLAAERDACARVLEARANRLLEFGDEWGSEANQLRIQAAVIRERGKTQ